MARGSLEIRLPEILFYPQKNVLLEKFVSITIKGTVNLISTEIIFKRV